MVESQMMNNDVTVGYLSVQDISERYTDEPRPLALSLWLDADDTMAQGDIVQSSSALDLYESLDTLQRYTETITDDCGAIAAVKFQLTEYQSRMLGLYGNQVYEFSCSATYPDVDEQLPWGFRPCL